MTVTRRLLLSLACTLIASVGLAEGEKDSAKLINPDQPKQLTATIKTSKGDISVLLYGKKAPLTVANFANLSRRGFYDGLIFHRVIDNFMVQTGCPMGTGMGMPGYSFRDEFHKDLRHAGVGVLSMANAGPVTNGSQFFITHVPTKWLDDKHSVFGKVTKGMAVVNKIAKGDKIISITFTGDTTAEMKKFQKEIDGFNKLLDEFHKKLVAFKKANGQEATALKKAEKL